MFTPLPAALRRCYHCQRRPRSCLMARPQTAQCVCDSLGLPHDRVARSRPTHPTAAHNAQRRRQCRFCLAHGAGWHAARRPAAVAQPHLAEVRSLCCALLCHPQAIAPELAERFFGAAMEGGPHRRATLHNDATRSLGGGDEATAASLSEPGWRSSRCAGCVVLALPRGWCREKLLLRLHILQPVSVCWR